MKGLYLLICILFLGSCLYATEFEDVTSIVEGTPNEAEFACWADLDNDGYPDLIVAGQIWKNERGKGFTNMTSKSGVNSQYSPCVTADFDGDGKTDLFFARIGELWLGNGDFTFTKGEADAALHNYIHGICAADFDNDGFLDVYVGGYEIWDDNKSFVDYRYKNENGKLKIVWQSPPEDTMRCHGAVTACDFNQDGWQDIYVGNYRLQPNFLWVNQKDGTFKELAREYNVAGTERTEPTITTDFGVTYGTRGHTISSVWADFNNDGLFDLFVGNLSHPPAYQDRCMFLENGGTENNYHFIDRSETANLRWQESYAGSGAGDYNNDGFIDLFVTAVYERDSGVLMKNEGSWKFTELPDAGGIASRFTYQAAWADFDRDGKLDMFTAGKLYKNVSQTGHYLQIKLTDNKYANTSAVGAILTLTASDGTKQTRQVEAGTGCGTQNDLTAHFGVGNNTDKVSLTVKWPDGKTNTYNEVTVDQFIRIIRN